MGTAAHAKGTLILVEDLDNGRDLLSATRYNHAPWCLGRVGRVVLGQTVGVEVIVRRPDLPGEAWLLGQSSALGCLSVTVAISLQIRDRSAEESDDEKV